MDDFLRPFIDFEIQSKKLISNITASEPIDPVEDLIQTYIKKQEELSKIKREKSK